MKISIFQHRQRKYRCPLSFGRTNCLKPILKSIAHCLSKLNNHWIVSATCRYPHLFTNELKRRTPRNTDQYFGTSESNFPSYLTKPLITFNKQTHCRLCMQVSSSNNYAQWGEDHVWYSNHDQAYNVSADSLTTVGRTGWHAASELSTSNCGCFIGARGFP